MIYIEYMIYKNITKYSTWIILTIFYSYQILHRVLTSIINDQLVLKYSIDADQIGQFTGMWYLGYVAIHIPLGVIFDHFNVKKLMPFCVLLTSTGLASLIYLDNFSMVLCGRLIAGVGCAASALGSFKLLILLFNKDKFPLMLGTVVSIGLALGVVGIEPIIQLMIKFGWTLVLKWLLCFSLILSLLTYIIIPNTKSDVKFSWLILLKDLKYIKSQPIILMISFLAGLMIGPLEGFADAWGSKYLFDIHHMPKQLSLNLNKMIFIGMSTGLLVVGKILEKVKDYYSLIIISGVSILFFFTSIIAKCNSSVTLIMLIFFVIGFFCSYQMIIVAKAMSLIKKEHEAFILAVMNMIIMGLGYCFHRIIGKVLKYFSYTYIQNKLNMIVIYQEQDYLYSFSFILVCAILSTFSFIYCKYDNK